MTLRAWALCALISCSCTFDGTGTGATDGASGSLPTGSGTANTSATTAGSSTTFDTMGDATAGHDCTGTVQHVVKVDQATVVPPMEAEPSTMGEGLVAFSRIPESGFVEFPIELQCGDDFALWGRVNDFLPGTGENDPDSFYVSVDGGAEIVWFYGCQTLGTLSQWSWQPVSAGIQGEPCETVMRVRLSLTAGTHRIRFRNREGENQNGQHAALARILVTNDEGYIPAPGQ